MKFAQSVALALTFAVGAAYLRAQEIKVHVLNGKTGKPIAKNRLLVFAFESDRRSGDVQNLELYTDENGIAIIGAGTIKHSRLQVWVDFQTQCVHDPNSASLSVEEILRMGLIGENTCSSSIKSRLEPGSLVVYARPPTLREKMSW